MGQRQFIHCGVPGVLVTTAVGGRSVQSPDGDVQWAHAPDRVLLGSIKCRCAHVIGDIDCNLGSLLELSVRTSFLSQCHGPGLSRSAGSTMAGINSWHAPFCFEFLSDKKAICP